MKKKAIIALLTDFGPAGSYVGAVKGVLCSQAPDATVVDITHCVPSHDVYAAGFILWSVYRLFPRGTIFVAVVDPGVGSSRILCCSLVEGRYFLHPDNGILDLVLSDSRTSSSVDVTNPRYRLKTVSATFHGRDILAPAAAALARGTAMRLLGSPRPVPLRREMLCSVSRARPGRYDGIVLHIDNFGNMITNFHFTQDLPSGSTLAIGRRRIRSVHSHYLAATPGVPFLLIGSSALLEIAVRAGSAAARLRAKVNDRVTLFIPRGAR